MRRFYWILTALSGLCFLASLPMYGMFFPKLFLFLLAAMSVLMLLLLRVQAGGGAFAHAAGIAVLVYTAVFVVWAVSFVIVGACITLAGRSDAEAAQADTIFVLGAGIRGDKPTELLRLRLVTALAVLEENPDARIIVCGGQGENEDEPEAVVMYRWLTEHGADADRVTMESKSNNTISNIQNALAICEKNSWDTEKVAIISNNFHLLRVRRLMEKCGLEPCVIAAPCGTLPRQLMMTVREYFSLVKLVVSGGW